MPRVRSQSQGGAVDKVHLQYCVCYMDEQCGHVIIRIHLYLPRNIQKKAQERRQQSSFPNSTPGLMPAVPILTFTFAIPRPALDLISMHDEIDACSVSASVDSARTQNAIGETTL